MRVGCFRSFKPAIHFGAKLLLAPLHAVVTHRLVFGGVRLDLRAVELDMPQLRHRPNAADDVVAKAHFTMLGELRPRIDGVLSFQFRPLFVRTAAH